MSGDFTDRVEPIGLFAEWLNEAEAAEPNDPNAMALATVDADGMPNVRMVLLKGVDERGFVFFTNFESAKGRELARQSEGSALLPLEEPPPPGARARHRDRRSTRPRPTPISRAAPRGSRIGAWASKQSRPLESRFALEKAVAVYGARYALGDIPRPDYWSGFRVEPGRDRVLVGRHLPPPRPHPLSRARARAGRRTRLYP